MQALRKVLAVLTGLAMAGAAPLVLAQTAPSPFDPLVSAVSFTDATTAIFAVAAILVGVSVVIAGINIVWNMVKKSRSA